MTDWFVHPAFQSLAFPVLLSATAVALLRAWGGAAAAPWGAVAGLVGSLMLMPGLEWPALSRLQRLPWVVLAGAAALAWLALRAARGGRRGRRGLATGWAWLATGVAWLGACGVLGGAASGGVPRDGADAALAVPVAALAGLSVLVLMALGTPDRPASTPVQEQRFGCTVRTAASLSVAALGLAALAAVGGSLLIGQLALMLACCGAVLAGAVALGWKRAGQGPSGDGLRSLASQQGGRRALMPLALALLALAWVLWQSWPPQVRQGVGPPLRLALLVLPLAMPALLRHLAWAQRHPRRSLGMGIVVSMLAVAAAVGWQAVAGMPGAAPGDDDPYYTPGG